jgi:hypothetical protein
MGYAEQTIAKHAKVDITWVAGHRPALVFGNFDNSHKSLMIAIYLLKVPGYQPFQLEGTWKPFPPLVRGVRWVKTNNASNLIKTAILRNNFHDEPTPVSGI